MSWKAETSYFGVQYDSKDISSAISIIASPEWSSSYLRLIKYRFNNLPSLSEYSVKLFDSQMWKKLSNAQW